MGNDVWEENPEAKRSLLTRSFLLDLDDEDQAGNPITDHDNSSVQVNVGNESFQEEEEEEECEDELSTGIKNMRMTAVRFQGKHTRFEYNSDDDEVVVVGG
ncbi:hypothetical protein SAY87_017023 [Trapa incisa]|uniref:Uncharacterized protein n=1 Tax=Trapa incisa TaxID=236973 RepID=A0AAN7QVU1_9MYRT|nr:hypothetical protein SAY87_017023 [Trapa incisa]